MQRRLSHNALASTMQVLVNGAVLFFLYRYLLNALGAEIFGVWALVSAWASLSSVAGFGLAGSTVKFVAHYLASEDLARVRSIIETTLLSLAFVMGLAIWLVYPLLKALLVYLISSPALTSTAVSILPYTLIIFWLSTLAGALASCLEGFQRFDIRSGAFIIGAIFYYGAAWWGVKYLGLHGLLYAQIAQASLLTLLCWLGLRRLLPVLPPVPFRWQPEVLREMLAYGLSFQAISFTQLLFEPTTKALLSRFGGMGTVAYYEMAQRLAMQLRGLVTAAHQAIVPVIAQMHARADDGLSAIYVRAMQLLLMLVAWSLPLLLGLLPLISEVWIGRFEPLFVLYGALLLTAWFVNLLGNPAYFANLGVGRMRENLLGHLIMGALNAALGYAFILPFGSVGPVVGFAIALAAGSLFIAVTHHMHHRYRLSSVLDLATLRLFLSSLIGLAAMVGIYTVLAPAVSAWLVGGVQVLAFLGLSVWPLWLHPTVVALRKQWLPASASLYS